MCEDAAGGNPFRAEKSPDIPPGTDYWSRVRRRLRHEAGVPWCLGDKIAANTFFTATGLPHAEVLARYTIPAEIDLDVLPPRVTLKPTFAHSSQGVFILERRDGEYMDLMSGRATDADQIKQSLAQVAERFGRTKGELNFIAEETIDDIDGHVIARDFKFLTFYDDVGLCIGVERACSPSRYTYWGPDLLPLPAGAVTHVTPTELAMDVAPAPPFLSDLRDFALDVSARLPLPMCRIDVFMSHDGPVLGEVTLLPGNFYYEDRTVLSAGWSARLGALWQQAEGRVEKAYGRYPVVDDALELDELITMSRRVVTPRTC